MMLGFYQVCPGCGGRSEYVLGLPLFSHIEIKLPQKDCHSFLHQCNDSNLLIIDVKSSTSDAASNVSETQKYIESVTWNGCDYDCAFFPHSMLTHGAGHLVVITSLEPNKSWGGDGRKCMDQFIYYDDIESSVSKTKIC